MTKPAKMIKCVVWDLDDTLWEGTLVEGTGVRLRAEAVKVMQELDRRGVLQAIASKNSPELATRKLSEFGISEYFVAAELSWDAKSSLLRRIAQALNIGLDTLLFVDDSAFERAEVASELPMVRCVDAVDVSSLPGRDDLTSGSVTVDGVNRRKRYLDQQRRQAYEEEFVGPRPEFLRSLGLRLRIRPARADDLDRAAELTERTNQLNTTGLTFSRGQLRHLMTDPEHTLLVGSLVDRFGSYGVVGLVLLSESATEWRIRLFLMSCRVMGCSIGSGFLSFLARESDRRQLALTADFRPTEVNRPMYLVYRLAGFQPEQREGETVRLYLTPGGLRRTPDHLNVQATLR